MRKRGVKFFLLAGLLALTAAAQSLPPVWMASDYARLHEGVNPPKLLHSSGPKYTPQALAAGIEGVVVLQVVISATGRVTHASVLSPLPAGLDATALAAIKGWQFSPGVMDAEKIPVLMTTDVLYRLPYSPGSEVTDAQRKAFQRIWDRLWRGVTPTVSDVDEVKRLAAARLVSAVGLFGEWKVQGIGMTKDAAGGMADVKRAAAANDAGALYFLGQTALKEKRDSQGWEWIHAAAFYGSAAAQRTMGEKREGAGKLDQAAWYFRFCAARGDQTCEYQLGRLMVSRSTNPNDFSQGVAWLELAKERGDVAAGELYASSMAKLSSIQLDWVMQMKPHLELRNVMGF